MLCIDWFPSIALARFLNVASCLYSKTDFYDTKIYACYDTYRLPHEPQESLNAGQHMPRGVGDVPYGLLVGANRGI